MFVLILLRNQMCKTVDLCIVLETKVHISNYCRRSVRNSLMYGDKQWLREIIECPSYECDFVSAVYNFYYVSFGWLIWVKACEQELCECECCVNVY